MTLYGEQVVAPFVEVPWSAALNFDFNQGMHQYCLLTGTPTTISFANVQEGAQYIIALKQDATGNRLVTWPAAAHFRAGDSGVLSTAANAIDVFFGIMKGGIGYLFSLKGFT